MKNISVPVNKSAMERLDLDNCVDGDLIELILDEDNYKNLLESNVINQLNNELDINIDDYEDEKIIDLDKLIKAKSIIQNSIVSNNSEAMAKAGASSVTGIDLAKKSLKIAQLHAMQEHVGNVSYRMVSVEDLAAEMPAGFGAVTCMEMLEHVPDPGSVVHACAQLVQPGGVVCFSTINRNIKSYMQAIIAAEYILQLMPHGTHDHRKFITPAELARLCRQAGLEWLG
ncbi:hypothetical protein SASC598O11_003180, partial [Snodgrassella alvi SCGC AB-598-O11]